MRLADADSISVRSMPVMEMRTLRGFQLCVGCILLVAVVDTKHYMLYFGQRVWSVIPKATMK
jgi:hypothetical protein